MSGGAGGSSSTSARLVLHLDVNKTVILVDPAGGKPLATVLNSAIADTVWGRVDGEGAESTWTLASSTPSVGRPPADAFGEGEAAQAAEAASGPQRDGFVGDLCSYRHYLDEVRHPYLDVSGAASEDARAAAVAHNRAAKQGRNALTLAFTAEGSPGEKLRPLFDKYLSEMRVPADKCAAAASASDVFALGGADQPLQRFLLPAYFRLIQGLQEAGRDFYIVFRTFGDDGPRLVDEHNLFCRGEHPLYGGPEEVYDGSRGSIDRTIKAPFGTGSVLRAPDLPGCPDSGVRFAYIDPAHNVIGTSTGFDGASAALSTLLAAHRTVLLQDDYFYWHINNETASCGKLFAFDPSDTSVHHIFFDDNICFEETGLNIVDARNSLTGEVLGYRDVIDVFAVKCQPTEALADPNYFLEKIAACEKRRSELTSK